MKRKVIFLISGFLGFETYQKIKDSFIVLGVMTDRGSSEVIEYCLDNKVPYFVGNPRGEKAREFYSQRDFAELDYLFSINYLYLINKALISLPKRAALNIHGSLLPKYRGRSPHVWAIINGEKETGVTVHLIDESCDTGAIVHQEIVSIGPEMTGGEVLNEFSAIYPKAFLASVEKVEDPDFRPMIQNEEVASSCPKRTPDDGEIDWSWSGKRIYDWVRSQAWPYPGAFSFVDDEKVIINKVKILKNDLPEGFSLEGSLSDYENGYIVGTLNECTLVKVSDGLLVILESQLDRKVLIEGKMLCAMKSKSQ